MIRTQPSDDLTSQFADRPTHVMSFKHNKQNRRFWLAVGVLSIAVHLVFCLQAFAALASGGMMVLSQFFQFFYWIFHPQFMSMALFCPDMMANYGFDGGIELIGWPRYLKWLVAAYPSSLVYGWVCAEAWFRLRRH